MDKNEKLDEEFRLGLASIRLFLGNLNSEDAKLCHSWLTKLYNSVNERILRNKFLKSLIENVKSGSLQWPFDRPPGLCTLSSIKACTRAGGECVKSWRSDSTVTAFTPTEIFVDRNADWEGYQTTDESEAVFPQRRRNKRRSEPFTLTRWKETPDEFPPPINEEIVSECYHGTVTLRKTIATLTAENEALAHEVSLYQSTNETTQKELYNLNQEVIALRAKLSELQKLNSNIERQHVAAISEHKQALTDSLQQVSETLKGVNEQNGELLNNVASLESKLSHLNRQSEDSERKLKYEISQLKTQLKKERKKHEAEILGFQNLLRQKNEQLKKVDCHVKKQCNKMQEEVTNIKQEMDHVANESNSQLRNKITLLKKDISKLERANQKLIAEYESRLQSCRKEYQLKATNKQLNKCDSSSNLEKAVVDLERKYKKMLSDHERRAALLRKQDAQKIQRLEQELLRCKTKQ